MLKLRRLRILKNLLGFFLAVIAVMTLGWLIHVNDFGRLVSEKTAVRIGNCETAGDSLISGGSVGLDCESAIAVDVSSKKILYSKNIHERLYPASLTKLMTALLLSEHKNQSDRMTYTSVAKGEPSNKMNFSVGTKLTADNAMKALLIFSANDVATMIAENVSGNVNDFASLMNQKAEALGMEDTHFANANGLNQSDHYTSAYDMSILARQVYKIPWILETMETPSFSVKTLSGKSVMIYNTNKELGKSGCYAGKTGNTSQAGWCLTAFYHVDGRTILGVVMKSPSENSLYKDMDKLIASAQKAE